MTAPDEIRERCPDAEHRLKAVEFVLAERERELLALKGPCSFRSCRLHYAHSGPCDTSAALGGDL